MTTFNILVINLIFVTTISAYSTSLSGFKINTIFSVSLNNFPLRNIAYDDMTNSFYVSGKNILYKFNLANFGLAVTKVTGPNHSCFDETHLNPKYCGDDENSVIVVTPGYLITCSTLYGGRCIRRDKLTLNEKNLYGPYIQLVSNITLSALGKLVKVTVKGYKYSKEQLLLFAKTPMELPPSRLKNLDRSAIFSVVPNLQRKVFRSTLQEDNIFDIFVRILKSTLDYRSMFENDDFVFILFNQNSIAKLAKLCKTIDRDNPKRVYEDIPISCNYENKTFNVVIHGKFINAAGARYLSAVFSDSTGSSALCMFSESEIYTAFLKSRRHKYGCPKHDLPGDYLVFEYSQNSHICVNMSLNENELPDGVYDAFNREYYCNTVSNQIPQFGIIIGLLPLVGKSVYRTQNIITVIGDHLVYNLTTLYLGTNDGSVLQTFVNESLSVHYIETIKIDRSKIRAIININEVPVILTENKIVNITPPDCGNFSQSCSDCMLAKSAYCGWCVLKQRCTTKLLCAEDQDIWLPSLKKQCLKILLSRHLFNINSGLRQILNVQFLPTLTTTRKLTCLIDGMDVITFQGNDSLRCEINFDRNLPAVEPGDYQLKTLLEGRVIAETRLLFYRCTDMKSCWKCLENSEMFCYWCNSEVKCTTARGECSNVHTATNRMESCPVVINETVQTSSGDVRNITFPGRNLRSELTYQCLVNKNAYAASLNITTNYLVCQDVQLEYPEKVSTKNLQVLFKYGPKAPSTILESLGNETFISVYKCEYLSPDKKDCSRCQYLKLSEGFNCTWCGEINGCVESKKCAVPQTCSPPEIDKIDPTDGPIGGGTLVKIDGRNLGASLAEVRNVTIAGVECSNVQFVRTSLRCRTGKVIGPISGSVMVFVSGLWSSKTVQFVYKAPEIIGIYPESIIKSGGRSIRITGHNINIGNRKYEVILSPLNTFGRNKTCAINVVESNEGDIVCIPEESDVLYEHIVRVVFDSETTVELKDRFLTYLPDPSIRGTTPPSTDLKSIKSGGIGFLVHGQGFVDVIENILISLSESSIEGPKCRRNSANLLSCEFPEVLENESQTRKKRDIVYQTIVIHIDGFKFVISRTVIYVGDPVLFELNGNRSYEYDPSSENRNISIKGRQMNIVTDLEHYFVQIGSEECIVLQLQSDTLICLPPYKEPSSRLYEDKLYVRVRVGNINTVVGFVQYPTRASMTSFSNNTLYIVLACLAFLVFIICAAIMLFRQRKEHCFKTTTTSGTGIPMENAQRVSGYDMLNRECYDNPFITRTFESHINENIVFLLENKGLLISKEALDIQSQIGKGHFGVVYEGSLTNAKNDSKIKVAVKTLHQSNPREIDVDNFLDEAIRMYEFNHPNVMTLIGICLSLDEMPLIVLPYMIHGDLLRYIRDDKNILSLRNLVEFAADISRGMEYLSIQRVVHRDLAARNCMLNECCRAVVADFGLSRDVYEKDYYSSSNKKTKLPVKWMAPESLEKGIYSSQSDVWSFGVVMWELVTRGSKPYPEVDAWDMLKYLKNSRRLPQPANCPDLLYTIMLNCWNLDPDQRPTFSDLVIELLGIVSPPDDQLETHSDYESLQNTYIDPGIERYLALHD